MGQTDLKPTAQGQVESSINDTINFIMAKVAAGEIDAATATELIAAARKDYESNVPVTTSAQQAVQPQQTANPYQADPQTAYAVPEMEPEQTPIDYGQFATSTNYPHTYDVEDSSDVDMDALSGIASDVFDKQPRKKLSRKERKAQAKEMKKLQKESNAKLKANAKSNKSIQKQLKDRDKELSKKNEFARYRRKTAKDVTSFIGYNRMYEDGICEVEEGMFSSCICFEDTSYHSVREDAQKAVFTSICRLYDQFGADTLVQFNIINTPLLKEQIGHRKFFNPSSQLKSRIVDFNLKDLPDSMLVFGLINVCEAVRNRMYFNAKRGVRTWLYVEEMQSMFAYPTVLNYFSRFSNEGRKFGLLLTGISQNAVAMLKNKAAQNLVLNSDFLLLLKQSPLDRAEWVRLLGLSEQEEEFIDESVEPGDGLLIAGGARVPIRGKFPSGNVLYDLFSTNPNEAADKKRMQEFAAREKSRLG